MRVLVEANVAGEYGAPTRKYPDICDVVTEVKIVYDGLGCLNGKSVQALKT